MLEDREREQVTEREPAGHAAVSSSPTAVRSLSTRAEHRVVELLDVRVAPRPSPSPRARSARARSARRRLRSSRSNVSRRTTTSYGSRPPASVSTIAIVVAVLADDRSDRVVQRRMLAAPRGWRTVRAGGGSRGGRTSGTTHRGRVSTRAPRTRGRSAPPAPRPGARHQGRWNSAATAYASARCFVQMLHHAHDARLPRGRGTAGGSGNSGSSCGGPSSSARPRSTLDLAVLEHVGAVRAQPASSDEQPRSHESRCAVGACHDVDSSAPRFGGVGLPSSSSPTRCRAVRSSTPLASSPA